MDEKKRIINVMVIDGDYGPWWGENKFRLYLQNCLERAKKEGVVKIFTLGKTSDPHSQPTLLALAGIMRAEDGIAAISLKGGELECSMREVENYLSKSDFGVEKIIICSDKTLLAKHLCNASEIISGTPQIVGVGFDKDNLLAA